MKTQLAVILQGLQRPSSSVVTCALSLSLALCGCASGSKRGPHGPVPPRRLEYSYAQLQMRDLEEVRKLVSKRTNEADRILGNDPDAVEEAVFIYLAAVRLLFSRPDQEGIRSILFVEIRKRLVDFHALDRVLQELTEEAIGAIRADDASALVKQTYLYILNNLMSEIKPEVRDNANFRDLLAEIRDADLRLSEKTRNEMLLRSMGAFASPSQVAAKILKDATKTQP